MSYIIRVPVDNIAQYALAICGHSDDQLQILYYTEDGHLKGYLN